jgi:hypothetical protein
MGAGIPLRATVTSFGPVLMSKVLGLNPAQEQSLGLIFHYADTKGLELTDLKDLRAAVTFLTSDAAGKAELKTIGGISPATAGVILRTLTAFEAQGAGTPSSASPNSTPPSCCVRRRTAGASSPSSNSPRSRTAPSSSPPS